MPDITTLTLSALYSTALWLAEHGWPRLALVFGGPAMLLDLTWDRRKR